MSKSTRIAGFTLVEMGIVLTIIALVVGGILLGHDLILSSRIQRTAAQIDRFTAASYHFKSKYNWLAGDMNPGAAQDAGLVKSACYVSGNSGAMIGTTPPAHSPSTALADGCAPDWWSTTGNEKMDEGTRESIDFYTHLALADLISGYYGYSQWLSLDESKVWPEPAVKRGIIYPAYFDNSNGFLMGISFRIAADGTATPAVDEFSPLESYAIDKKLDDGKPTSGQVIAVTAFTAVARDTNGDLQGAPVTYTLSANCCKSTNCPTGDDYDATSDVYKCTVGVKW